MGTVTRSDGPSAGQAHTLHMQRPMNLFMRGMLRTPGLAQLVGRRFLTLYVVGRKTGKQYCVPAAYIRHEGSLLLGTQFGWGRNLRTGEPLDVRYQGRRRVADVVVIQDEEGVIAAYGAMCRANHAFADFHRIGFDQAGEPDQEHLHRAWESGARAFMLTPR